MNPIAGIEIPTDWDLFCIEKNVNGETNDVFSCKAMVHDQPIDVHVKVAKSKRHQLSNEQEVLKALSGKGVPVPSVLCYRDSPVAFLVLKSLPGRMLWDYIDPRREWYSEGSVLKYLRLYGECLARIHGLPLQWAHQKRSILNGLIGEETIDDNVFKGLVSWLREHLPSEREEVFVHGDLNTANVLFMDGEISGVVDWEFAGLGWREYDLAWVLRARRAFLNTEAERQSILEGYRQHCSFDGDALRWCEVLNHLHFAYWNRRADPEAVAFSVQRAQATAGL